MWLNCSHACPTIGVYTIGSHLLDVVEEEPVEEDLVGVLQAPQVDVPLQVVSLRR